MELPDFPSNDYLTYLNNEKDQLLLESTNCLNNMRDYLERNVFCNAIGGSFQDIIESLTPENMINYSSCEVDAEKLIKMLQELINYGSQSDLDKERFISFMDYVITLTSSQGFILPFAIREKEEYLDTTRSSFEDLKETPEFFSNAKGSKEDKQNINNLWLRFSQTMTDIAKKYLHEYKNPKLIEDIDNYGKLLEIVLLFNSPTSSWKIYKECRQLSFAENVQLHIKNIKSDDIKIVYHSWEKFTDVVIEFLSVDCKYISVLFEEISNAQEAILNYYLDCTAEQVKLILEKLTKLLGRDFGSSTNIRSRKANINVKIQISATSNGNQDVSQSFTPIDTNLNELKHNVSPYLLTYSNFEYIIRLIASFARMENRIDVLLNNQWSTHLGVNIEPSISSAKKPKGVLKKIRRPSRLLSSDINDYRMNVNLDVSGNTTGAGSKIAASPVFEEEPPTYVPCIEWQSMIEPIFPAICTGVEYYLCSKFDKIILGNNSKKFFIESLNQPSPVKVSESLQNYLRFIEEILPLVLVCNDHRVEKLMLDFHACLEVQISRLHSDLQMQASQRRLLTNSVQLLSDSTALQLSWSLLNNIFKPKSEEIGTYFFKQKKLFSDFQKLFIKQIIDSCYNELVSVVLQDSKSNFWCDIKEFHENSRVGYPIQAWHIYLQKLWYLLSSTCSQTVAREVLADVVIRSLEFLVQRYASARPTKRRVPQVRADMIAIFHIVEYFIYKISENVDDLFGFGEELSKLKRIHFACMSLLQVVFVLTSPLDLLKNQFGAGFNKGMDNITRTYSNSFWLNVIKPDKYPCYLCNDEGMNSITSESSCLVVMELLLQPNQFESSKVIETICHQKMMITAKILNHLCVQLNQLKDDADYDRILDIFLRFYRVITLITEPFNHLHTILVEIINNTSGWAGFHKKTETQIPVWLAALYELLVPYVDDIAKEIVQIIAQQEYRPNQVAVNLNSVLFPNGCLPCGCDLLKNDFKDESMNFKENKDVLKEIVKKILTQSLNLPQFVQSTLSKLQEQLELRDISVPGGHFVFDCLLESLRRLLNKMEIDQCKADTIWMEIIKFLEDDDSVSSSKETIINIYGKKTTDFDINPFQEIDENRAAKTFFLGMQYNQISGTTNGLEDLKFINKFLRRNGPVIKNLISTNADQETNIFDLILTDMSDDEENSLFCPLEAFCKIGGDDFNHKMFYDLNLDWEQISSTDIGLSEISFETILYNRWELEWAQKENDSNLGTEEKKNALLLLEKYGLDKPKEV